MSYQLYWTGFEPFGGNDYNPSWDVARAAGEACRGAFDVSSERLPVEFGVAERWATESLPTDGDFAVIHVGLAETRSAVNIERVARNHVGDRPDEAGECPGSEGTLCEGGEAVLESPVDVPDFVDKLSESLADSGLPDVRPSDDAGSFVCNAIYFHSLRHVQRTSGDGVALFVHVPELTPSEAENLGSRLGRVVQARTRRMVTSIAE